MAACQEQRAQAAAQAILAQGRQLALERLGGARAPEEEPMIERSWQQTSGQL